MLQRAGLRLRALVVETFVARLEEAQSLVSNNDLLLKEMREIPNPDEDIIGFLQKAAPHSKRATQFTAPFQQLRVHVQELLNTGCLTESHCGPKLAEYGRLSDTEADTMYVVMACCAISHSKTSTPAKAAPTLARLAAHTTVPTRRYMHRCEGVRPDVNLISVALITYNW